MTISLNITADSAAEVATHLTDLAALFGGKTGGKTGVQSPAQQAPAQQAPAQAEPTGSVSAEKDTGDAAPRRRRRTKAEMEAARQQEAQAKVDEADEADEVDEVDEADDTTGGGLTYDKDLRPEFVKIVNEFAPEGRTKAVNILAHFGVKNGKELSQKDLPEALKMIREAYAELKAKAAVDDDDGDDDEFEV